MGGVAVSFDVGGWGDRIGIAGGTLLLHRVFL